MASQIREVSNHCDFHISEQGSARMQQNNGKGKEVVLEDSEIILEEQGVLEDSEIILEVLVVNAINIDRESCDEHLLIGPIGTDLRAYNVLYWVEPDNVYETHMEVSATRNPEWRSGYRVPINRCKNNIHGLALKLEVIRFGSLSDIGTTDGKRIVGRAKIPLPKKFLHKVEHHVPLVVMVESERRLGGFIHVDLMLRKMVRRR